MKKIFKYLSILLSVALLGSISACNLLMDPLEETAEPIADDQSEEVETDE